MRFSKLWLALALNAGATAISVFTANPALAQVDTGAIRGTVTDASGAVVVNAKVELRNEGTGLVVSTVTASDGTYTFNPVKIASYRISVEAPGFRKATTQVVVNVQEQARADFQLVPGAVTESVEVSAAPPQMQTQDASVGTIATGQQINDLPLNGRNYTFLAQLGAGVTPLVATRHLEASGSFVANGLTTVHNSYLLDGIDNNNDTVDFLNGAAYVNLPPPDAIQEFKVQTSNFSAEFGRAGGAVINAAIKSGTNQFHGTAWEFVRNDKLDAVSLDQYFFNPKQGKGELRRNQFGGALGGPIRKNKLFIFGDYEGTRVRTGVGLQANVPTDAVRTSGFTDFRDLFSNPAQSFTQKDLLNRTFNAATILDPATTRPATKGQVDPVTGLVATGTGFVRDPFYTNGSIVGITDFTGLTQFLNQLPGTRLDPNAIKLLGLYPAATVKGAFVNNYQIVRSEPDDSDHFDIRADQNFSDKDQMFGRVSYSTHRENIPSTFTGDGSNIGFDQGAIVDKSWNLAASETHSFSPTLINEARFGYSRLTDSAQPSVADVQGIPAKYGIPGIPQGSGNGGLPGIDISGLTSLGAGAFASPNRRQSDTYQFTENLTKAYGGHSFKGGFEYQRLHFPWIDPAWSRGNFSFGGYTGITNVGGSTGMADILLTPTATTVANGINNVGGANTVFASNITQPDDLRNYYGTYFQDDWKVNSKLTINMGLRWEIFRGLAESSGKQAGLVPGTLSGAGAQYVIPSQQKNAPLSSAFAPLLAKDGIQLNYISGSSIFTTPLTNFAPRVGLAYRFTPKLVARAAYGVFYGGFENLGGAPDPGYNYPFTVNLGFFRTNDASPLVYPNGQQATLENGLTAADPNPASPNFSPSGLNLVGFQRPWKTAYTQEWNGSVEYQLTPSQTVTVAYVGNNTHHMLDGDKRNIPSIILPPGTDQSAHIPFPDFSRNSDYVAANGSAYYHSVQVAFERRFSHGLNLLANYTRSECMTDTKNILGIADGNFARAPTLPGWGRQKDYQYCGNDVPNIFHASGIWELPFGKGKRFGNGSSRVLDEVIGGWSAQWIFTLQDGFPFPIVAPGSAGTPGSGCPVATTADFGCYPDVVSGQSLYAHKGPHGITQFLNPAAFAQPPAATTVGQTDFSPLGGSPTPVHGPGFENLDMSVFKRFQVTEKTNLEFRSEFFNTFNHPNFSNSFVTLDFRSAQFSQINGTRGIGRQIQLALKLYW
jgi:Carboxypeptidase regulatory-like domain/TonB dependent receptor